MLLMILKLALATCIYIAVTVLLWHFWHKHEEHTLTQKLAIGLFYGLCSVISSHIGIDYGDMVLNVRDLGPLAAGLFFDPLAGILSGLIGGIINHSSQRVRVGTKSTAITRSIHLTSTCK